MKKAAILSITAFYLLLTTGLFVCAMHCAAEKLFNKPGMQMGMKMARGSKHCTRANDCGCCKTHGTYTVNENLKPIPGFLFSQTAVLIHPVILPAFLVSNASYDDHGWADVKAPPGKSGRAISIQFRSLLI